jgi:hypothetical protein
MKSAILLVGSAAFVIAAAALNTWWYAPLYCSHFGWFCP